MRTTKPMFAFRGLNAHAFPCGLPYPWSVLYIPCLRAHSLLASTMDPNTIKNLVDKLYDKRKLAASDVERCVRWASAHWQLRLGLEEGNACRELHMATAPRLTDATSNATSCT